LVLAQVGQTGMAWVPCGRPPWLLPVPPWLLATPPWLLSTPPVGLGTAPEGLSTPPEGLSTPPGLLATPPWRLDSAPGQLESAPEQLPNRTVVLSGAPEGLSSQPGQLDSAPEVFAGAQAAVAVVSYHRDTKPGRYPWRRAGVSTLPAHGACVTSPPHPRAPLPVRRGAMATYPIFRTLVCGWSAHRLWLREFPAEPRHSDGRFAPRAEPLS
jgi:hypothetical protein